MSRLDKHEQITSAHQARPYPALTPSTAGFWESGREGVLSIKRCEACARFHHPPMVYCPYCLSTETRFETVSGYAALASYTVNHHSWHPAFTAPYILAIVELREATDIRLTTRLVDLAPDQVRIGMMLKVVFEKVGPAWLPLFGPGTADE